MDYLYCYGPLLTFLVALITQGESIRCYFCSYSPEDRNNRTDKCTDENFQPDKVYSDECPLGCETFIQYDSNDMMEHWRRNCLQDGHEITNDCRTDKTLGWKHVRCTCNKDLCNMASIGTLYNLAFYVSLTMTSLWSIHMIL